ncbi:hypothetical protein ZIOFF_063057 [Zingiber officinale]|uniref:Origin recognition complex subunit 2 n=1 Tax=Zingiber officinale TaxID=94328 RepID=A0A8J5K9M0_ZINOF|nr:hypothetical protein ZIOFF_063057 [Zingiber officinale]
MKEKLVKISVNGVEAGFNMYLDHKGEAFFLRDAEDGEQEFFMSPPTSGDETEGRTKNDQFEKTQSFYVEGGQKEMVTQMKEKLVKISVNGVEAGFNMYLDHKGEAFFLRDAEDGEQEFFMSPPTSGDETEGRTKNDQFEKTQSFYVEGGQKEMVTQMKEKLVKISVNGVEAGFNMYLDHKGEAFFLRDAEDGEQEFFMSPPTSGDETEGRTKNEQFEKTQSFYVEGGQKEMVTQVLRKEVFDIPVKHENEIQHLIKSYRNLYPKWLFELRCGFGLLMYGFGSKKALLEDFASTSLTDFGVVVINGYLPSNNLKQVLRKEVFDIPVKHENEIQHLIKSYRNLYPKWLFELRCGFGLLMYGFGSKKALLEDFASTSLTDFGVVVINGYLPSNNLKQALITLAEVLSDQLKHERKSSTRSKSNTEHTFSSLSIEDLLSFLNVQLPQDNNCFVCVIIHNIDGPSLRDPDSQQYLAQLASCSRVRMVASIDHVNAPLCKFWLTCISYLTV